MLNNSALPEAEMGKILWRFLQTEELRRFSGSLADKALQSWAGDRPLRKRASGFIDRRIRRTLDSSASGAATLRLKDLFADPGFMQGVTSVLPQLLEGLSGLVPVFLAGLRDQPADSRKKLANGILKALVSETTGNTFNTLVALLAAHPESGEGEETGEFEKRLSEWISTTDFGLLRQWLDDSESGIENLVRGGNSVLWRYPAKLVILLSLMPYFSNQIVMVLKVVVSGFNDAPPDLIADIIIALLKDIRTEPLADLVNEGMELLGKVQVGGALIGDPGASKTTEEIVNLLSAVHKNLDEPKRHRVKTALQKERSIIRNRLRDRLFSSSEHLEQDFAFRMNGLNLELSGLNHRFNHLLDLPDLELNRILTAGLDALDRQEAAEILEQGLQLLLRVVESQPQLLPGLISDLFQQVAPYDLRDLLSGMANGTGTTAMPLARAVVPNLVTGICGVLAPRDDEFETDAEAARNALRSLLCPKEEQS